MWRLVWFENFWVLGGQGGRKLTVLDRLSWGSGFRLGVELGVVELGVLKLSGEGIDISFLGWRRHGV